MANEEISIVGFLEKYPNEESCRVAFEKIRFRKGDYCPHCGNTKIYRFEDGRYRCAGCKKDFNILTGTAFGHGKVSLRKWFIAIYLLTTCRKGISSVQLSKQVGVTQKTAWFMDHRIRQSMKQNGGQLFGTIEIDETYVGGKAHNKHASKRKALDTGRTTDTKAPVFGMLQREGQVRATVVENVKSRTVEKHIVTNIAIGSQLYTDSFTAYDHIGKYYPHEKINHSIGQYVRPGGIHTNGVESFWAVFKRGYVGIYHWMSHKHLYRYVDEFSYRFNNREENFTNTFADVLYRVSTSEILPYKVLTA